MSEPIVVKLDNLPMEVKKDKVGYVSYCPALDIYSQGESEEEAIFMLAEAIKMFVKSCFDRGVLFQVLEHCGWRDETNYSIDFKISMVFDGSGIEGVPPSPRARCPRSLAG